MAALTAVTITCPRCDEPVTVPVILTEVTDPVDGRRRPAFELDVRVRFDTDAAIEHTCPTDHDHGRRAAA